MAFIVTELAQGTFGNEVEYPVSFPLLPVVTKPWQKMPGHDHEEAFSNASLSSVGGIFHGLMRAKKSAMQRSSSSSMEEAWLDKDEASLSSPTQSMELMLLSFLNESSFCVLFLWEDYQR